MRSQTGADGMWDWIGNNVTELNLVFNGAMLLVWMAYLQLFLQSFRRSNRAVIHIDMAVKQDLEARCLVANMGSDAVYLLAVKVGLDCRKDVLEALVTDKLEDDGPLGGDFRHKTTQGPLRGGEVVDIGSFRNIVERAAHRLGKHIELESCRSVEITVVVAAQQAHRLMGGYKRFDIHRSDDDVVHLRSPDVLTRQIVGWRRRRSLTRDLKC